jgi:hypothetical protein
VQPHIAVPAGQALETAHADALRKLIAAEEDEQYQGFLQWALTDLESRLSPLELTDKQLEQYVGQYGPRRVFLDGGGLFYQREGRAVMKLEPMGMDLFRVGDLEYFRASFGRDDKGRIVKFVGLYDNGNTDENLRDN